MFRAVDREGVMRFWESEGKSGLSTGRMSAPGW